MKLKELISSLPAKELIGNPGVDVKGVAYHSRRVEEGFLFAAVRGLREDGNSFAQEALSRGAHSFLVDRPLKVEGVTQVIVPEVREALARISASFYGDPSSALTLVGITGTNGKTTTAYLIESILQEEGKSVGVIGTVNYRFQGRTQAALTTTPESADLQKNLHEMQKAGVTHVILEVSSHALDLQRVRGCHFDIALFTNLSRDHLDYHRSMENYFRAKQLLFTRYLKESGKKTHYSVINVDDPKGEELSRTAGGTLFRYGVEKKGEVWPERIAEDIEGIRVTLHTPRGSFDLQSPLIGGHNLYNILAAVSVGEIWGLPHETIAAGIKRLQSVPGRLERVPEANGFQVFVDFAHTGDALEKVLETLQRWQSGRLILVFGCGGDRDRGKRPMMGKVAGRWSDFIVITSDNPRSEDPLKIIEEVEKGVREAGRKEIKVEELSQGWTDPGYLIIPDRREAIRLAIGAARPRDIVLIAGKGHEDYQIIGSQKIHFNDREEAGKALNAVRRERGD